MLHNSVQSTHLWVQVLAELDLLDEVLPHIGTTFVCSRAVRDTNSFRNIPALDLLQTGLANSEEVLWLLGIRVGTVSLES